MRSSIKGLEDSCRIGGINRGRRHWVDCQRVNIAGKGAKRKISNRKLLPGCAGVGAFERPCPPGVEIQVIQRIDRKRVERAKEIDKGPVQAAIRASAESVAAIDGVDC